jgi:hypothetical protein
MYFLFLANSVEAEGKFYVTSKSKLTINMKIICALMLLIFLQKVYLASPNSSTVSPEHLNHPTLTFTSPGHQRYAVQLNQTTVVR